MQVPTSKENGTDKSRIISVSWTHQRRFDKVRNLSSARTNPLNRIDCRSYCGRKWCARWKSGPVTRPWDSGPRAKVADPALHSDSSDQWLQDELAKSTLGANLRISLANYVGLYRLVSLNIRTKCVPTEWQAVVNLEMLLVRMAIIEVSWITGIYRACQKVT